MRKGDLEEWSRAVDDFYLRGVSYTGRFERWLARGILTAPRPARRLRCAYFACFSSRSCVTSALIRGARDKEQHYLVRGQCLERLASSASRFRPRTRRDRKVYRVVLECLEDPHPNVRFWACFAAAGLHLRSAQTVLRSLRDDEGVGDMGWTVGYEATEALKAIRGEPAWEEERLAGKSPYPPLV